MDIYKICQVGWSFLFLTLAEKVHHSQSTDIKNERKIPHLGSSFMLDNLGCRSDSMSSTPASRRFTPAVDGLHPTAHPDAHPVQRPLQPVPLAQPPFTVPHSNFKQSQAIPIPFLPPSDGPSVPFDRNRSDFLSGVSTVRFPKKFAVARTPRFAKSLSILFIVDGLM